MLVRTKRALSLNKALFVAIRWCTLGLYILLTQHRRDIVHRCNDNGNCQHLRACSAVVKEVDILLEQETDAATANKPDNGGHAHVDIPAVHGVGNIGGNDLWNNSIDNSLQTIGTCCF